MVWTARLFAAAALRCLLSQTAGGRGKTFVASFGSMLSRDGKVVAGVAAVVMFCITLAFYADAMSGSSAELLQVASPRLQQRQMLYGSAYAPDFGEESGVDDALTGAKDDIRNIKVACRSLRCVFCQC